MIALIIAWYAGIVIFALPWVGLVTGTLSSEDGFMVWMLHVITFLVAILWDSESVKS